MLIAFLFVKTYLISLFSNHCLYGFLDEGRSYFPFALTAIDGQHGDVAPLDDLLVEVQLADDGTHALVVNSSLKSKCKR